MSERQDISIQIRDDALLVTLMFSELDEQRAGDLEDQVAAAVGGAPDLPVILDFSQVEQIAEDSLGALVDLLHGCKKRGQRFILAGLRPSVLEILSVTKLGRLFEYREDIEDALAHLGNVE
jgi:anti-anti-sigma factor